MRISRGPMASFAVLLLAAAAVAAGADAGAPLNATTYPGKIKVACVGDSITFGYGIAKGNSYPEQLQRMLGDKFDVENFGVNSVTLLSAGDKPYIKQKRFADALAFKPDVVVLMLGANDTKANNWPHKGEFSADLRAMVERFIALESHPRIWLMRPTPIIADGKWGINEPDIEQEIPLIDAVAKELHVGEIDAHAALAGKDKLFPDHVHPNAQGAEVLAGAVYQTLEGKPYAGPSTVAGGAAAPTPGAATRPAGVR